jgi:uncharacterized protein YqeY
MSLIEKINADIITAYKARTTEGNETKALLTTLKGMSTKVNKVPKDEEVIATIKSMIKGHTDSIEKYSTPTLTDLELTILNSYLPKQMTDLELTEIIKCFVSENKNVNMGAVMSYLKANFDGLYDGKSASQIVKAILL